MAMPEERSALPRRVTMSVIVCAYNEERTLAGCLHSVLSQTRPADEILVVNNASSDGTREVALGIPGVELVDEPRKGLTIARETGRRRAKGDVLVYLDADCRAPLRWLERIEQEMQGAPGTVAVSGPYHFYDWTSVRSGVVRVYDWTVAPLAHVIAQRLLGMGALLYGGNFAVRREALERIGGFDETIEFHGEDTNLARRLVPVGHVVFVNRCWLHSSARRYRALGTWAVFRLYVRNFWSEVVHQRPRDVAHVDVRI
jgi:glycosyltransferase involved in cell wall biosynthesis